MAFSRKLKKKKQTIFFISNEGVCLRIAMHFDMSLGTALSQI